MSVVKIDTPLPWPTIIISSVGVLGIIYAATPATDNNRRTLGIIMSILWPLAFALILLIFWNRGQEDTAWWMLLLSLSAFLIFYVVVIMFNAGGFF